MAQNPAIAQILSIQQEILKSSKDKNSIENVMGNLLKQEEPKPVSKPKQEIKYSTFSGATTTSNSVSEPASIIHYPN